MADGLASDMQEADDLLSNTDALSEAAYLVSRGVRPLALVGHCPDRPNVMLRIRGRLAAAAQRFDALVFIVPESGGSAAFGYAAHRWVIDLLTWALSDGVPPERKHEILGLLLGYSPAAIARHQERDHGSWLDELTRASLLAAEAKFGTMPNA